jgi:23S rRNA (cytidine1920-2'-O)/16S rRNA (cytidine1409-2'-O)-methyltransferase
VKGERLDIYLYRTGLAESRERARAYILAGIVYVNGERADKAGFAVPQEENVEVRGNTLPYVSRGGLKLEKALQAFNVNLAGLVCMDIGASTGGFTDCMLQNGAAKVYAVDVGYGQLAWKLRSDERVINMERTNIRHVQLDNVPDIIQFFSVDVSFISLKHIFPVAEQFCAQNATGVCLVKPQFEAGREKVGKKGVVRSINTHEEVLMQATDYAVQNGFSALAVDFSPVKGPEGNIEFLLYVQRSQQPMSLPQQAVKEIVLAAHAQLGAKED